MLWSDTNDCRISEKVKSVRPPEILCQILHFAVGPDGIRALLPFTHVCARWRRVALADPSLWTTIHLKQTTIPLLNMILASAGNQLFTVHIDHDDLDRLPKLWELVDRIKELHCSIGLHRLALLLSSGSLSSFRVPCLHFVASPSQQYFGLMVYSKASSLLTAVPPKRLLSLQFI